MQPGGDVAVDGRERECPRDRVATAAVGLRELVPDDHLRDLHRDGDDLVFDLLARAWSRVQRGCRLRGRDARPIDQELHVPARVLDTARVAGAVALVEARRVSLLARGLDELGAHDEAARGAGRHRAEIGA